MGQTIIKCECVICGKSFSKTLAQVNAGWAKYCSDECRSIGKMRRVEKTCATCGKSFSVRMSYEKRHQAVYCSKECQDNRQPPVEIICAICGKSFLTDFYQAKLGRKYCSMTCLHISQKGEGGPRWLGGHQHYRGENWFEQRRLVRERDGDACQHCGKIRKKGQRRFHVHHIKAFRDCAGWEEANRLENLITLCPACHSNAEVGKIILQPKLL